MCCKSIERYVNVRRSRRSRVEYIGGRSSVASLDEVALIDEWPSRFIQVVDVGSATGDMSPLSTRLLTLRGVILLNVLWEDARSVRHQYEFQDFAYRVVSMKRKVRNGIGIE